MAARESVVNRTGTIIESEIRDRLVGRGQALFDAPHGPVQFAKLDEADRLLNDLDRHPHAFVIACVMNRQIKAERAWLIPHAFAEKLGGFSMETLARLSRAEIRDFMAKPAPLHHFVEKMSGHFWSAVQRMATDYGGDASGIWAGRPASAAVVYRFLEFDGVGPKIASMAANILARDFKIPFADYYSIDISADVHVRRVFGRLGLCAPGATIEQLVYKARALHPAFPGIMDLPSWEIGRNWCKPRSPLCGECYMKDLCPAAKS
jgi:endonuclease III